MGASESKRTPGGDPKAASGSHDGGDGLSQLTGTDVDALLAWFDSIASNETMPVERVRRLLDQDGLCPEQLRERLLDMFMTSEAQVDFTAFIRALAVLASPGADGGLGEEKLAFAFRVYDVDGDGFLKREDLFAVMEMMVGEQLSPEQLQQVVDKTVGQTEVGKVSFDEFKLLAEGTSLENFDLDTVECRQPRRSALYDLQPDLSDDGGGKDGWPSDCVDLDDDDDETGEGADDNYSEEGNEYGEAEEERDADVEDALGSGARALGRARPSTSVPSDWGQVRPPALPQLSTLT